MGARGEGATGSRHWARLAARWSDTGPPLRPSAEDVAFLQAEVDAFSRSAGPPRAVLLGVTPEVQRLRWPPGSHLVAVDRSRPMIEAVWPGPRGAAIQAAWTSLPLRAASRDVAFCDGGFHLLDHPSGTKLLAGELARVLAPGGMAVIRCFVPPARREDPEEVLRALVEGRIANMNVLKIRLGMAMADSRGRVRLAEVWDAFSRAVPDPDSFAAKLAWPPSHVRAIETYRGSQDVYTFVPLKEIRDCFEGDGAGFALAATRVPRYPLGERFPTLVFRREADASAGRKWLAGTRAPPHP